MQRLRSLSRLALGLGSLSTLLMLSSAARAQSTTRDPGAHPDYGVELEPHGLLQWDNDYSGDTGIGLGMHAVIPFLRNGPISSINDNMGIGFGLDWGHFSDNACGFFYNGFRPGAFGAGYCNVSANSLVVPVYVQWNFFLTRVISVFGEGGFGIQHDWASIAPPAGCPVGFNCTDSHTYVIPYFEGGARFMLGDSVGLLVRAGYPFLTVGVSILL